MKFAFGKIVVGFHSVFATVKTAQFFFFGNSQAHDSFDMLPVLLGMQPENEQLRDILLVQTWSNNFFVIRQGPWKYIDGKSSGGNNYETSQWVNKYTIEDPTDAPAQLYNLDDDPGETTNLFYSNEAKRLELKAMLDETKASGRSAPTGRTPMDVPTGCKDPAYAEYDAEAIFNNPDDCITSTAISGPIIKTIPGVHLQAGKLSITFSGPHTVTLHLADGTLVQSKRGKGPSTYNFSDMKTKSIYILRIQTGDAIDYRKMMFY